MRIIPWAKEKMPHRDHSHKALRRILNTLDTARLRSPHLPWGLYLWYVVIKQLHACPITKPFQQGWLS